MCENKFIKSIMSQKYCKTITICGSAKFRNLKEKYHAYYTIKNNLVFIPINYASIQNEIETPENVDIIIKNIHYIHDRKMYLSDAILVVNENGYIGEDTMREILQAHAVNRIILYTYVPDEEKDKYYFNNDLTYPLYMLKEEYK